MEAIDNNAATFYVLIVTLAISWIVLKCVSMVSKKRRRYAPGPWGFPFVGHLPLFGDYPPTTFARWRRHYGNVFRLRLGSWNAVVLNGFDAIKEAADMPHDVFSDRPGFLSTEMLKDISGADSLAFGRFTPHYVQQRKRAAAGLRPFVYKSEHGTAEIIIEETNELVNDMLARGTVEPRQVQYCIASIIHQLLFGVGREKHEDVKKQLDNLIDNVEEFTRMAGNGNPVDVIPWLRYFMSRKIKIIDRLVREAYWYRNNYCIEHLKTYRQSKIRDIIDVMIKNDMTHKSGGDVSFLKSEWLLATVGDLHGAGFDTTNKMIQSLLIYMASFPDVQRRVQKEIDDVIGKETVVEMKDRARLVYTDATIHEVMRCAPNLPFALPHSTAEDATVAGYDIDKGTVIIFNLYSIMQDEGFWEDPKEFRPSRLITEDGTLDSRLCSHIVPFSFGRRKCVGNQLARIELFLVFTTIMQKCTVRVPTGVTLDLRPIPGLTYSPKPFTLRVTGR